MTITEKIDSDIKLAMKAQEKDKLLYLRNFKSALKYKQIDKNKDLTEDEEISVLTSVSKKLRDSLQQAESGGRDDIAAKARQELDLLMTYLPEQMGPEEIEKLARETLSEFGEDEPVNFGMVMKNLMPKLKGKADGNTVKEIVQRLINK